MSIPIIIVLIVVALIVIYCIVAYNTLTKLKNRVKTNWAQIDVVLKRRADLIPNLVETVKGYASHEKETLENAIKARNTYVTANSPQDQLAASGELNQALSRLMMLGEAYPDLKANTNFMELQKELTATEDKITYARQFYNDSVTIYNTKLEVFPSNMIAKMFNFKARDLFEAESDEARKNVKVDFSK